MLNVLSTYNPYVPWDPSFLERGVALLRSNMGSAINIGIYISDYFRCLFGSCSCQQLWQIVILRRCKNEKERFSFDCIDFDF